MMLSLPGSRGRIGRTIVSPGESRGSIRRASASDSSASGRETVSTTANVRSMIRAPPGIRGTENLTPQSKRMSATPATAFAVLSSKSQYPLSSYETTFMTNSPRSSVSGRLR